MKPCSLTSRIYHRSLAVFFPSSYHQFVCCFLAYAHTPRTIQGNNKQRIRRCCTEGENHQITKSFPSNWNTTTLQTCSTHWKFEYRFLLYTSLFFSHYIEQTIGILGTYLWRKHHLHRRFGTWVKCSKRLGQVSLYCATAKSAINLFIQVLYRFQRVML